MKRVSCVLFTLLAAWLPAKATAGEAPADLAAGARAAIKTFCHRCHNGPGSPGGDFDMLDQAALVAPRGEDKPYVVPGKPAESLLLRRLEKGLKLEPGSMPPRKETLRPAEADVAAVRRWIEAGAVPFPEVAAGRAFVSLQSVLTAVRNDLRDTRKMDRPFRRYFTLTHLYNDSRILDGDLRLFEAALAKAVNSLSGTSSIVLPRPIDKARTVFAIDVRALDWDRGNLWEDLVRAYPYGLEYGQHPDTTLQKLDEDIRDLSDCDLSFLRADWFVAAATRPPLYHTLLRLPNDARELEKKLDVDIADNFRKNKLTRAGFAKSGVSGQNRLVERHGASHGAYWKSYDFKPGNGLSSLTRFPLGPLNLFPEGRHPFPRQAFVHDGGEIIFNLPNGLQGYLLVNGKDGRIDEGPIDVVSDSQNISGTPAIVTGLSCMACHKHGMIPFKDTLNAGSAVFGEAEQKVKDLYPDAKTMAVLVKEDQRRFLGALEKVIGPILRVGADKDRPLEDFPEPIGAIAYPYRHGFLDLKTLACELGLEKSEQLVSRVGRKKLKQLGLEALLNNGGLIGRLDWEAVSGTSLMQDVARELGATPARSIGKPR